MMCVCVVVNMYETYCAKQTIWHAPGPAGHIHRVGFPAVGAFWVCVGSGTGIYCAIRLAN